MLVHVTKRMIRREFHDCFESDAKRPTATTWTAPNTDLTVGLRDS